MSRQYYYFIASLPNVSIDDSKLVFAPENFREQAKAQLSAEDYALIELIHLPDDISNLLLVLYKKTDKEPNSEGLKSPEYWQEYLEYLHHKMDTPRLETPPEFAVLPAFIGEIVSSALSEEELPDVFDLEHALLRGFFSFTKDHSNEFVSKFFELERNIKNILTAINGRNHELDFARYLIGEDETVTNLSKSHAADFGLGKDHPLFDSVFRIWEQNNILYRERGYDVLRNKWIDEQNFFEYFNINRILGYYVKIRIINRWQKADAILGKEVFHDTLNKLENSFEFPEDFNIRIKQK
jgi:hypothetical protein